MAGFLVAVYLGVTLVLAVTAQYVFGRILLPEVGLHAPSWGIWFWADLAFVAILFPIYLVKGALDS